MPKRKSATISKEEAGRIADAFLALPVRRFHPKARMDESLGQALDRAAEGDSLRAAHAARELLSRIIRKDFRPHKDRRELDAWLLSLKKEIKPIRAAVFKFEKKTCDLYLDAHGRMANYMHAAKWDGDNVSSHMERELGEIHSALSTAWARANILIGMIDGLVKPERQRLDVPKHLHEKHLLDGTPLDAADRSTAGLFALAGGWLVREVWPRADRNRVAMACNQFVLENPDAFGLPADHAPRLRGVKKTSAARESLDANKRLWRKDIDSAAIPHAQAEFLVFGPFAFKVDPNAASIAKYGLSRETPNARVMRRLETAMGIRHPRRRK